MHHIGVINSLGTVSHSWLVFYFFVKGNSLEITPVSGSRDILVCAKGSHSKIRTHGPYLVPGIEPESATFKA